jgi:hypothetical protein
LLLQKYVVLIVKIKNPDAEAEWGAYALKNVQNQVPPLIFAPQSDRVLGLPLSIVRQILCHPSMHALFI